MRGVRDRHLLVKSPMGATEVRVSPVRPAAKSTFICSTTRDVDPRTLQQMDVCKSVDKPPRLTKRSFQALLVISANEDVRPAVRCTASSVRAENNIESDGHPADVKAVGFRRRVMSFGSVNDCLSHTSDTDPYSVISTLNQHTQLSI